MALSDEFLKQSRALARRRGRPSQINLRRATSAAYYALFHLLIGEAVELMVPAQPSLLRARASRAFQHGEVKEVCINFQNVSPPKKLGALLGPQVSKELQSIAKTFLELQEERHNADYDIALKLSQSAVLSSVANAEAAFEQWRLIRVTEEANVFLTALIFGKRWDR
jgi:hypothetical protein